MSRQKRTSSFDWQVCRSDTEWAAVRQAPQLLAARRLSPLHRWLAPSLCLLVLLAAGGLRWHSLQTERAAAAATLGRTLEVETEQDRTPQRAAQPTVVPWSSVQPQVQPEALAALDASHMQAGEQGQWSRVVVQPLDLTGEVAVIQMTLEPVDAGPAYRQTRVYRRTGSDWVRMDPAAAYWGAPLQWETEQLVFVYNAYDAQAVAEVAAELDARYAELHQLFLGQPPTQPLMVVVDPAHEPGQNAKLASWDDALVVASPAVYLTPEGISDAELLAQSLLLALLDELADQVLRPYAGEAAVSDSGRWLRVRKLLEGVRLWQVWQGNLPLAAWRKPVVQWVFSDARPWLPAPSEVVPSFRTELCAMHRLWMSTPFALNIPLSCHDALDTQVSSLVWRLAYEPPLRLAHFPLVSQEMLMQDFQESHSWWDHPAATVALATVMEYVAATYGPERIGVLVAEAGHHEKWATLIPAVFGVSADEFEADWQTYLTEQYAITLPPTD
jgi:hypothetical protein